MLVPPSGRAPARARRALPFVVCLAVVLLTGMANLGEARSAPGWMSRFMRVMPRRAEPPVARVMPAFDSVVVFGPKLFSNTNSGAAAMHWVEAFTVASPDSSGYVIRITNGPSGLNRSTTGTIRINNRTVIIGEQLAQIAAGATKDFPILVAATDTMTVDLSASTAISVSIVSLPDPRFVIFGPMTYIRVDAQETKTDTFMLPIAGVMPAYLCVRNGNPDGTLRDPGLRVTLNGTTVVSNLETPSNVRGS